LAGLSGCVGYVDGNGQARVYVPAPAVYVEPAVVVQDDYVYYPGYQVYYSSSRRQYMYLEGSVWVTRPSPPHISASVLFASPSVRLNFHDSPANHHAAVSRQYPKHWAPSGPGHDNRDGREEKHRD
jgi:hypothetical protein